MNHLSPALKEAQPTSRILFLARSPLLCCVQHGESQFLVSTTPLVSPEYDNVTVTNNAWFSHCGECDALPVFLASEVNKRSEAPRAEPPPTIPILRSQVRTVVRSETFRCGPLQRRTRHWFVASSRPLWLGLNYCDQCGRLYPSPDDSLGNCSLQGLCASSQCLVQ